MIKFAQDIEKIDILEIKEYVVNSFFTHILNDKSFKQQELNDLHKFFIAHKMRLLIILFIYQSIKSV